jgi:hypothetical protein
MSWKSHAIGLSTLVLAATTAVEAQANPRPLPYTYIYETLPAGDAEIELYTDLAPVRVINGNTGAPAWYLAPQFQAEIEYGLTDRLELGLYLTLAPIDAGFAFTPLMPDGTGIKQRLRYRLADAGVWPIDVAVYGEVVENQREIELEGKVILQRRAGPFRIAANAWAEREYYFSGAREWVLNPTAGIVLERWIKAQPGIEYWMHAEHIDGGGWVIEPQHYIGPTVILQLGKIWWSIGAYARINDFPHAPQVGATGNPYGPFWFRTVVGISF